LVGLYREYKGYLDVIKQEGAMRAHPVNWRMDVEKFPHFMRTD